MFKKVEFEVQQPPEVFFKKKVFESLFNNVAGVLL